MSDNQKIIEARREIKNAFDVLPIFKRSRQAALYNFCAVLELESFLAGADPDAVFQVGRDAVEATIQAIPAIFDKCPHGIETDLAINRSIYEEAFALFYYARDLERISFCFELADREQFNVRIDHSSGAIAFEYASKQEAMADTHLRSSEWSSKIRRATPQQKGEILEIALAARDELRPTILFCGVESITYDMTPLLKSIAARWAAALVRATEWYFPDYFVIDAYTVAEIREFWVRSRP